jgi:hypothetical protein
MKKYIIIIALIFAVCPVSSPAADFTGNILVDGFLNPGEVPVTNHNPLFSWEYTGMVSSFTLTVSLDTVFLPAGEEWNFTGSTTIANTINGITRTSYNADNGAQPLLPARTYFWRVTLYENGASASRSGQFTTLESDVSMNESKLNLAVGWNNPFNPLNGQVTKFRFSSGNRDRRVKVRIFTLSGELVKEWPEQTILMDAWYSVEWDGKNRDGETVAAGIYLVNLFDPGEGKSVTKRLAVIK